MIEISMLLHTFSMEKTIGKFTIFAPGELSMVTFRPFAGFLPKLEEGEDITDRISPPYDIIDKGKLDILRQKRFNVTRITLNSRNGSYEAARNELEEWINSGALEKDKSEYFYLYRQSFVYKGRELTRTGLVGRLKLEPYSDGNVIPHEETIPHIKEDRLKLLRDTHTHAESIFGLYRHQEIDIGRVLDSSELLFDCKDPEGVRHRFYRIASPPITESLEKLMEGKKILIADGHHRYETALRYSQEYPDREERKYVLATLVSSDDEGMLLLPTHRLVSGITITRSEILRRLEEYMYMKEVENLDSLQRELDERRGSLGFLINGKCYLGNLRNVPSRDILWTVGAHVCQKIVFERVLEGMELSIEYEENIGEMLEKLNKENYDMAVLLGSLSLDDVWKVADMGMKMPKKSTFFYPKIWSGFVYYRMV